MNLGALVSTSSYEGGSVASILTTSLLVNLPQVLFSSLYFMYNSIYTCMASTYEWSQHARVKKGIRVTDRIGYQRSSYWLQMPWKFSLPLLIASAILHWLISQSAFLVNVSIYTPARIPMTTPDEYIQATSSSGTITAIGYSPLAMMCGVCVVFVMLIALVTVMQLPLKSGMPLVGSNSFAISAACHPPENDRDVARKKIMWGAAWHQQDDMPGHCCFTSFEVEPPRVGEFYAGDHSN